MKQILCLLIALGSATAVIHAQNFYFPPTQGNTWATLTPASQGFCPERIDSLYHFLSENDTKSFLLLKDGKIVLEKYFGTFTQDSFWYWASAGKSLTAFLVGQAQDEGILDIQDPTSEYLGAGWTTCTAEQESKITLWHQLTMTSGLNDNVPDDNCVAPECLKYLAPAGTRWAYHNGVYHLLHDVIEAASGQTIQQFTKSRLLDKTGMKGLWINHIQYGRARDMARFGLLNLAGGVWNGDTLLHNRAYFEAMSKPSQNLNKSYGYLWWLNGQASFMLPSVQFVFSGSLVPNAPADTYAALGKNDQKIHVVPSKGWVIVRQGNAAGGGNSLVPTVFDNDLWYYLNLLDCTNAVNETSTGSGPVMSMTGRKLIVQTVGQVLQIRVLDISGRQIASVRNSTAVVLPDLPESIYFVNIYTASGVQTVKIRY